MAEPTLSKKRYVPLSEAARISGYTREYVERLCRIGKIPCRLMGEKTIVELDALLSQTGTILLGGEHVGFIELDDNSPYPLIVPVGEVVPTPTEAPQATEPRFGRIAVVGETFHDEEADEVSAQPHIPKGPLAMPAHAGQTGEKFPSNALPFFSSMGKGGKKPSGVHIAVSTEGVSATPISTSANAKHPFHIAVAQDDADVPVPRTSSVKGISVMPREVPADFVPAIATTPASFGSTPPPHDHDLMNYSSKLPMLFQPLSLTRKVFLGVFAMALFVLPTALGVGEMLNGALMNIGSTLNGGTRGMMAAVGLIDPNRDTALFPYLEETSRLLSASGASGNGSMQTGGSGVVVSPSTGNQATDQAVKDAIQKTFSDPVEVIPDAKDGQSGMIRPIFQKNNSAGYIYMMVPVRN